MKTNRVGKRRTKSPNGKRDQKSVEKIPAEKITLVFITRWKWQIPPSTGSDRVKKAEEKIGIIDAVM